MTDTEAERQLRELFTRLRDEDRARAPSLEATLAAASRRRRPPRRRTVMRAVAAAAAVVAIALGHEHRQATTRRERALAEAHRRARTGHGWNAPTDFLLDTPGSRLLRTVPSVGTASWPRPSSPTSRPRSAS